MAYLVNVNPQFAALAAFVEFPKDFFLKPGADQSVRMEDDNRAAEFKRRDHPSTTYLCIKSAWYFGVRDRRVEP